MADTINKKYKVTATILTPLHIGAGAEKDWAKGMDYINKDGTMYHLDVNRMFVAGIDMNKLSVAFASGRPQDVERIIGSKLEQCSDFQMTMPIPSPNPIKVFLRNQLTGDPIIAGSSLKGAIRSILFTYLRAENERRNDEVFGKLNDGSDFMRFIRVGDFEFEKTCLLNSKIYNLENSNGEWQGGWKSNGRTTTEVNPAEFNTIYECLLPNAQAIGSFMLSEKLFLSFDKPQPHKDKKAKLIHSVNDICDIVRNHTFDYIEKELTFFETFEQGDYSSSIFNSLIDIQEAINACAANECILKMSAGSGFHSITGDWQFSDYVKEPLDRKRNRQDNVNPKTRKTIFYKGEPTLMGFVKLRFDECNE